MKKLMLVGMLLVLAGCTHKGNEVICSPSGRLYTQMWGSGQYPESRATDMRNTRQVCVNQPDGSIVINNVDKVQ